MEEIWKDVKGFEGVYQISNKGRLKSFKKNPQGYILKQTNKKGGYFCVVLEYKGKNKHTRIHRLVAEAFIPNPNNLPQVNHIDGDKQNNEITNLEWCTISQNILHSINKINKHQTDAMNYYNKYVRPKKIIQFDLNHKFINIYANAQEASIATGVCARNILQVASKTPYNLKGNTRKQAGGYIWEFKKEDNE